MINHIYVITISVLHHRATEKSPEIPALMANTAYQYVKNRQAKLADTAQV